MVVEKTIPWLAGLWFGEMEFVSYFDGYDGDETGV